MSGAAAGAAVPEAPDSGMKKYRQAGYGFFLANAFYLGAALWFLPPPFNTLPRMLGGGAAYLALLLVLSCLVLKGARTLTRALAVVYAGRSLFTGYSLLAGGAFPAAPFFLPCLLLAFYLLGRAGWNWP